MIGISLVFGFSLSSLHTLYPSIFGIAISRSIKSICSSSTISNTSWPSRVVMMSYSSPSRPNKIFKFICLSSTIKILFSSSSTAILFSSVSDFSFSFACGFFRAFMLISLFTFESSSMGLNGLTT